MDSFFQWYNLPFIIVLSLIHSFLPLSFDCPTSYKHTHFNPYTNNNIFDNYHNSSTKGFRGNNLVFAIFANACLYFLSKKKPLKNS